MLTPENGARYRWAVAARVLLAAVGGYILSSLLLIILATLWPLPQAQALAAATLLSFLIYALIIIWVFSAKHLGKLCLNFGAATLITAAVVYLLLGSAL